MAEGGEWSFDWAELVPFVLHPMRVAIIEALLWIRQPLSPKDFSEMFFEEIKSEGRSSAVSYVSYHASELRKAGAIEVVGTEQVRGALRKFYFFTQIG